ncbi:MAG: nucleoside recognition domain-containing protein [Deltaproteobacteria bacterium]
MTNMTDIVVIGKENTGKSQLIASLTGKPAYSANFRGSTVSCDAYSAGGYTFYDTPGIMRQSDAETTRIALGKLREAECPVLMIAKATHLDEDLSDLLPLAEGRSGIVGVTFWDKVHRRNSDDAIRRLSASSGLRFICVDARRMTDAQIGEFYASIAEPSPFPAKVSARAGWRIEPKPTLLETPILGQILALLLLFLPAIAAVWLANGFAESADPIVAGFIAPIIASAAALPAPLQEIAAGRYGFLTMFPLLFVWAAPTVLIYALYLGIYKASGLIERITSALHPLMRPFGLAGRDLARVVMGFGCNVPAVISSRSASACSHGTCLSAIAFGSACSYQMGATLAVFSAAAMSWLVFPYLAYLALTTLVYSRLVAPKEARSKLNLLVVEGRTFLEFPKMGRIWAEARGTIAEFFLKAIPIFILITAIASALSYIGVIELLGGILSPAMGVFNLPSDAAMATALASVRKDGILLFTESAGLAQMTALQVLTGVYLAGALLPCLVTAIAIGRERSARFVLALMGKQAAAALVFSAILAWVGLAAARLFGY